MLYELIRGGCDHGGQACPEGQGLILHASAFRPGWCHNDVCSGALAASLEAWPDARRGSWSEVPR